MDAYLKRQPGGKKLHDPLALAAAPDETVCQYSEVQMFVQKGQWGARPSLGSNTWISIDYDAQKFQKTLLYPSMIAPWKPCERLQAASGVARMEAKGNQTCSSVSKRTSGPTSVLPADDEGKLNKDEKLALRLATKLHEIQQLEKEASQGVVLAKNQLGKVASKADNIAAFRDVMN